MRGGRGVAGVAAVLAMTVADARAGDGDYGVEVVAVDVSSDLLIALGVLGDQPRVAVIGGLGYGLGGPIVHVAHGNYARAAGSLGVRVGLPIVGGLIGGALGPDGHTSEGDGPDWIGGLYIVVGMAVGMVAAQVVDPLLIVPDAEPAPAMLTFRF